MQYETIEEVQSAFLSVPCSLEHFLLFYGEAGKFGMPYTDFLYPHGKWEEWYGNERIFDICCDTFVRKSDSRPVLVERLNLQQRVGIVRDILSNCKDIVINLPHPDTSCEPILEGIAPLIASFPADMQQSCLEYISKTHRLPVELWKLSLIASNFKPDVPSKRM